MKWFRESRDCQRRRGPSGNARVLELEAEVFATTALGLTIPQSLQLRADEVIQ